MTTLAKREPAVSEQNELTPEQTEPLPWYYRRNALAFGADMALFHSAISLIGATTVLPTFLAALTDSEVIVGLSTGISSGAWLLPQLVIASLVARKPRKKPVVVRAAWLSRPVLLLMALTVWLVGADIPALTLAVTLLGIAIFYVGDACATVPWFDLVAKGLPLQRRGRILGAGQVIGSLGAIGAGVVVRYVLGPNSPLAFPSNYAALFGLCGTIFFFASLALLFIHEPDSAAPPSEAEPVHRVLASIPRILASDRIFRRVVIVRVLVSFTGVASAFYVLYATRHMGFGTADAGLFVSAQVVGSMAAGALMGLAQDRWGPLAHMRFVMVAGILPPALTLLGGALQGVAASSLSPLFLAIYFFLGLYGSSIGWPFFNWILEHAPEDRRPLYVGLINTLTALAMVAPAFGGWVVGAISYPAVFWLALAIGITALALTTMIPNTRKMQTSPPAP